MLAGSYPMSVDAKARVTLPAVFRKQLIDGDRKTIYLVPMNGCVNGFTPEGFERFVDGLFEYGDHHYDPRSRKDVQLRTGLWASAVEVDIDSRARSSASPLTSRSWAQATTSRSGIPRSGTRRRRTSRTTSTRFSSTTSDERG